MNINSVLGKNWTPKTYNEETVKFLKENFNLSEIVSRLIAIRKIKNLLPNPFILKDMDKAVNRTFQAIINKEITGIFGDYDVDGATSTAILGNYFNEINHEIKIYIPDRKREGYGPSINGYEKLISQGAK